MKKGFSLIELLVSLVIISAVMVFLTSFVLNLRDEKGEINIDVQANINQASISRALNYDAIEHGGICRINISGNTATIKYVDEAEKKIILNNKTLTYNDEDTNKIELVKTLNGNKNFSSIQIPEGYPKKHGNKKLYKYIISTSDGNNIEVVSYNSFTSCPDLVVTWKNYDGTVLKIDEEVEYGSIPTYSGSTPTRAATAQYTYTFSGWSPEIDSIMENTEYTATYTTTTNKYTVTWKNYDGTVLETDTNVAYGATPTYNSSTPTRAASSNKKYTFKAWSPTVTTVTGNAIYTATYTTTTYTCSTGVSPSISGSTCSCSDTHEVEKTEYYAATPGNYSGYCHCSSTSNGNGDSWSGGCGHDTCSQECASIGLPYVMAGSNTTCPRSYSCDKPNSWGPDSSHYCGRHYYVNEPYTYDCTATTS